MTLVRFETSDRQRALGFLKTFYPSAIVEDVGEVARVLDLVARDVFRIPDPSLHPNGAILPSKNMTAEIMPEAVKALHKMDTALRARLADSERAAEAEGE